MYKLRIAVLLGGLGEEVYGNIDPENPFGKFITGTVSGFLNMVWGLAERNHTVDAFCKTTKTVANSKLSGVNFYPIQTEKPGGDYDAYIAINEPDLLKNIPQDKLRICAMWRNDFTHCHPDLFYCMDMMVSPSDMHLVLLRKLISTNPIRLANRVQATIDGDNLERASQALGTVIPLGVNPEQFGLVSDVNKVPGRLVWCSSPGKGLHHLISLFPEIKRRIPSAELRIFHQCKEWIDQVLAAGSTHPSYSKALFIKSGIESTNSITVVGAISPKEFYKELSQAMVYPYTLDTLDGFSMSVLDACSVGCIPVMTKVSGLPEAHEGAINITGDPEDNLEAWIIAICKILTYGKLREGLQTASILYAKSFTRQKIAVMWEATIVYNEQLKRELSRKIIHV